MPINFSGTGGMLRMSGGGGGGGAQGPQGSQGPQGDAGAQGFQGNQGTQGSQGFQGDPGVQGNQGQQGSQGSQGTQGTQGSQGFQGASGAGSGDGWITAYSLDFTTLSSGSLVNGSNSIDGKSWTVQNRSNVADLGINPSAGEGLTWVGRSDAANDLWNTTRTSAIVTIKTSDLDSSLTWPDLTGMRVFTHLSGSGMSAAYRGLVVVLENWLATTTHANLGAFYGYNLSALSINARTTIAGSGAESTSKPMGTNDVICIEWRNPWTASVLMGTYSDGWPTVSSMSLVGWIDRPQGGTISSDGYGLQTTNALALSFAFINVVSLGTQRVSVKRIKIDKK